MAGCIGVRRDVIGGLVRVRDLMVQEVVEGVQEPTRANRIMVDGKVAVFDQVRNLRFINRFGEYVVRARRCYKSLDQPGSFAPLDATLGIEGCFAFSPLMTMLICLLGAEEAYERSATNQQHRGTYLEAALLEHCGLQDHRRVAGLVFERQEDGFGRAGGVAGVR